MFLKFLVVWNFRICYGTIMDSNSFVVPIFNVKMYLKIR